MELMTLQGIYRQLLESATDATFVPPTDPNAWPVELVLAHVVATNRTLCIVGAELLDGRQTEYEGGTISTTLSWLTSIIESGETMHGLLATLHQSSEELLALARRCDDGATHKKFPATIYDGHGEVLFNGLISFNDLLTNLLVRHLSGHLKQIQALREGQA